MELQPPDWRLVNAPVLSKESLDARRSAPPGMRRSTLISTPLDGSPEVQRDMVQCCHCGRHWQYQKGSGKIRGICSRCHGITCGPTCPLGPYCIPQEKALELMAQGHAWQHLPYLADSLPVSISVPAEPPRKIISGN